MENKKKMDERKYIKTSQNLAVPRRAHSNTMLNIQNDTISSQSSSSDSTISSTGAAIMRKQQIPKTQLLQEKMDLQYNKYLRTKLMQKLATKFQTNQQNFIYNQAYQLAEIKKKFLHLKLSVETENNQMDISNKLKNLINENSKYLDETIHLLADDTDKYKDILNDLKIFASKMSVRNIDLTDYDNEKFTSLLQSICNSLKSLSTSDKTNQMIRSKEIFEQLEKYNQELEVHFKECSQICNNTAQNVVIATAGELMNKQNKETN